MPSLPLNPLQDHGSPQLSSTSYVAITVVDRDDRNPKFTRSVYRASVKENYPIKVGTLDNTVLASRVVAVNSFSERKRNGSKR